MFQIGTSPARRTTASALSVLAAIGASGAASQATAAVITLEPSVAARTVNSSYAYLSNNWYDWLAEDNWHAIGGGGTYGPALAWVTWNIDFDAGLITDAKFRVEKNNESAAYGIPAGAHLNFHLVTEPWSSSTPKPGDPDGPNVGTTPLTEFVQVTAPAGATFDADITTLIQHWQLNPTAYFGVRLHSPDSPGGMVDPNEFEREAITAELVREQRSDSRASLVERAGRRRPLELAPSPQLGRRDSSRSSRRAARDPPEGRADRAALPRSAWEAGREVPGDVRLGPAAVEMTGCPVVVPRRTVFTANAARGHLFPCLVKTLRYPD